MTCECTPARLRPDALEAVGSGRGHGARLLGRPRPGTSIFQGPQGDERFLSGCTEAQDWKREARVAEPGPVRSYPHLAPPCAEPGHHLLSGAGAPEHRALSLGTRACAFTPDVLHPGVMGRAVQPPLHRIHLCPVLALPGGARRCRSLPPGRKFSKLPPLA